MRQRGAVDRHDVGFDRDAEERVDVASDERGELFESLALGRQRVRVAVLAAGDVECELRRRRVPGVGSLLAEHREDVAEHVRRRGSSLTGPT